MEIERPYCTVEEPESDNEADFDPREIIRPPAISGPVAPLAQPRMAVPSLKYVECRPSTSRATSAPPSSLALTHEMEISPSESEGEMTEAQR